MSDQPVSLASTPEGYADWLGDLKTRILSAQQRAALGMTISISTCFFTTSSCAAMWRWS